MCSESRGMLSLLGLLWGVAGLTALVVAFASGSWLYTKEPVTLPDSQAITFVSFQIGLWRVCPSVMRVNTTARIPSPLCSLVKYTTWEETKNSDLEIWTNLELAQTFISRMRLSTFLDGLAVFLLLLAVVLAFVGHYNNDSKAVVACGFFILGGLSLGTGLVFFASAVSNTMSEIAQFHRELSTGSIYECHYGWCFFLAGVAFIMSNLAALFSILGYLSRFSSVDEMVRQTVPGAERKLREHQHLSTEYLVRHMGPTTHQYDSLSRETSKYDSECGPLLTKTPPDVCSMNKLPDFGLEDTGPASMVASAAATAHGIARTLAGQTVPIIIKNTATPLTFTNFPDKYGTLHRSEKMSNEDFCAVSEQEGSTSFGGYYGRSKTLQPNRSKKKCVAVETFQESDTDFVEYGLQRTSDFGFTGSAV